MGGFFGSVKKSSALFDVFIGTDYHSHLGTKRGGMAAYDKALGLQREIHNIENAPFRTKFERVLGEMKGNAAIGCISDTDPQPLLMVSKVGTYAICTVGVINNAEKLMKDVLSRGGYFDAMTGSKVNTNELVAALINSKDSYVEGIRYAQKQVEGTASILLLTDKGTLIAARDKMGRLPVHIGKCADGYCVSFESFAYRKLGYTDERELGPAEIVEISADGITQLAPAGEKMRICAFLWSYYGYPTSNYEGVNVEMMRCKNGEVFAKNDAKTHDMHEIDYVGGVPDSGTPHAIGYANACKVPFARPYIKYTPTWSRSFMPVNQTERNKVAKMKLIPVHEFIEGKRLLLVDDSIVRGTTSKRIVNLIREAGAKEIHMRISCPPFKNPCYFGTDIDSRENLIACKMSTEEIAKEIGADTLGYLSVEGVRQIAGNDAKCGFCDACFTGNYPCPVPKEMPKDKFEFKIQ